jgi:hypothetical protein
VAEAAKIVRGMKQARVAEFEMELDCQKIAQYRATTKIYFDLRTIVMPLWEADNGVFQPHTLGYVDPLLMETANFQLV